MKRVTNSSETSQTAEDRYRQAFERLKRGETELLPQGTPVSQNNVAKEAGKDPTALKKARFPTLVREIQAHVELDDQKNLLRKKRQAKRRKRESLQDRVKTVEGQRDFAQSQLVSAHHIVLKLLLDNADLQRQIDELRPPPTRLG